MSRKSLAPKKRRARRAVEQPPLVFDWPEPDVRVVQVAPETKAEAESRRARVVTSAARSAHLHGASAVAAARAVAVPDAFEAAIIGVHIRELCRAFYALGQSDAAMALMNLREAVEIGDPHLPARFCAAADPWTARGRRPSEASLAFRGLVPFVDVVREPPAMQSEERTVAYVVESWIDALGVPPGAYPTRPEKFFQAVFADETRIAKMTNALRKGDSAAFVKFVHRELGYPGTNNLGNAEIQRRSRAHRSKKRSASKR